MYKAHIQIKLSLPVRHISIYRAWSANTVFITIDKNNYAHTQYNYMYITFKDITLACI